MSKLKNAPLQEVIFEILWDIDVDEKGIHHDVDFPLAQGIFAKEIHAEFPIIKKTVPDELLDRIYPLIAYQFWKGINQWPVVQIGPGILAVNDTEVNYDWDSNFQNLILTSISTLEKSFGKSLIYKRVSLRYIDAFDLTSDVDVVNFLNKNFNLSIHNNFNTIGNLVNVNFNQTFRFDETSYLTISITNGFNKNKEPAIIWQTQVYTDNHLKIDDVSKWVNIAHDCASKTFKNILSDEFYNSFN